MTGLEAQLSLQVGPLAVEIALQLAAGGPPLALIGPNGAGKTSVLLALLGLLRPHAGKVLLDGRCLFDARERIDLPPEERAMAYVPQDYALFPHLDARQNVEFALSCLPPSPGAAQPARRQQADALLSRMGVAAVAHRRPAQLSGGEKQRVALARALARAPRALLFDEPFAALDAVARVDLRRTLAAHLRDLALPAVLVTHERADVEALQASVVVLERGRVTQRGSLRDLAAQPATEYVAAFCAAG